MKKHLLQFDFCRDQATLSRDGHSSCDDLTLCCRSNEDEAERRIHKQPSALSLSSIGSSKSSDCFFDGLSFNQQLSGIDIEYFNTETSNLCLSRLSEFTSVSPLTVQTKQVTFHVKEGQIVPRLKQPKGLFALGYDLTQQHSARWPEEMQVITERIKHIPYVTTERESLYKTTYIEQQPPVIGDTKGRVVYYYKPLASTYFVRSCVGGSLSLDDVAVTLRNPEDTTLIFESRFESGNLEKAVQTSEFMYELYLSHDLYSERYTQWYYFRLKNTRAGVQYRFSIVNFCKNNSLYNNGAKPLMYSELLAENKNIGWHRAGMNICYYRNNLPWTRSETGPAYTLTFTCEFPYDDDTIYFAHCYPYTYSDLQDYMSDLQSNEAVVAICKQRVLCRSLAGNLVPVLTITSGGTSVDNVKKRVVMITARVHPGETSSSWVAKGIIDFLISNAPEAKALRTQFIFKIIPMLNPDGVIVGNYRCCLTGRDLNRQYRTVLKNGFPSVWYTKHFVTRLMEEHEIFLYCDLHGHSLKHNMFIYGCENRQDSPNFLQERIFPFLLKKFAGDKFCLDSCKYKIQRGREGTGRVVMWRLGITNSFTLEMSLGGCTQGKLAGYHFNIADFESMGRNFCEALLEYGMADSEKLAELRFAVELQLQQQCAVAVKTGNRTTFYSQHSSDDKDSESSETESLSVSLTRLNLKSICGKGISKGPFKGIRRKSMSLEEPKAEV